MSIILMSNECLQIIHSSLLHWCYLVLYSCKCTASEEGKEEREETKSRKGSEGNRPKVTEKDFWTGQRQCTAHAQASIDILHLT